MYDRSPLRSCKGACLLPQNPNFLPVDLHSLPLRPPIPPDKCFPWRLRTLLPAVTPPTPRLNPGDVACACCSAFLCLPGGWCVRRAYKAHGPPLSPWMHYVNVRREAVRGCCRAAFALKQSAEDVAISIKI